MILPTLTVVKKFTLLSVLSLKALTDKQANLVNLLNTNFFLLTNMTFFTDKLLVSVVRCLGITSEKMSFALLSFHH